MDIYDMNEGNYLVTTVSFLRLEVRVKGRQGDIENFKQAAK